MRRPPSERRAALAARQLHYHRERLRWMLFRMRENEDLIGLYLTILDVDTAVLPGGFRVGRDTSPDETVGVEKLAPKSPCEQLVLPVGERRVA